MIAVYRQDIQGLRALAVLAVIAFHYDNKLLSGGFVGVDIFLVISGYLITSVLLQKKNATDYKLKVALKEFYISRVRRIMPAYFAMLVLVSIVAATLFIASDFGFYNKSLEKSLYFYSNHYFAGFGDYFAPGTDEQPLLHTWSLAVEIQFYLLLPFLVLLMPSRWIRKLIPIAMMACLLAAEYMVRVKGEGQSTYYALYARIPEFLAGSCLAIFAIGTRWTSKRSNLAFSFGLLLIIASTLVLSNKSHYPGLLSLLPVTGAALIIGAHNASYNCLLRWPLMIWLGALSYSLYLWHWPVLAFIRYYTQAYQLSWQFSIVFVLLTLLLSVGSYYWVESQFHRPKAIDKKMPEVKRTPKQWLAYIACAAMLICITGISKISSKLNIYFSPQDMAIEYQRYADPAEICHGQINGTCIKGNLNATRKILVLGDSHAAMLNHFFDVLGKQLDFSARIITASSCVTIPGFVYERLVQWAQKPCREQIAHVLSYIETAKIIVIAGSWSYHTTSDAFITALTNYLADMQKKEGVNIYILSQVPRLKGNAQRVARFRELGLSIPSVKTDVAYREANSLLQQLVKNYRNSHFIQLSELELFKQAPFYQSSSGKIEMIYYDEHHLNQIGVTHYAMQARGTVMGFIK